MNKKWTFILFLLPILFTCNLSMATDTLQPQSYFSNNNEIVEFEGIVLRKYKPMSTWSGDSPSFQAVKYKVKNTISGSLNDHRVIVFHLLVFGNKMCEKQDKPELSRAIFARWNILRIKAEKTSDNEFLACEDVLKLSCYQRYKLKIPNEFKTEEINSKEKKWRKSLINKLAPKSPTATFMLTNIKVLDGESIIEPLVYQNTNNKEQFLVNIPKGQVIIDFGLKLVGTSGTGGISYFYHPDHRMVVSLDYSVRNAIGVPVGNPKTECPDPVFGEGEVCWTWPPSID